MRWKGAVREVMRVVNEESRRVTPLAVPSPVPSRGPFGSVSVPSPFTSRSTHGTNGRSEVTEVSDESGT